jgi:phenylalanyl-tRNA synthetase beta chain
MDAIRQAGKGLVRSIEIFDVFRGGKLGDGRKSLAFHVLLHAEERTVSDQDVAKFLARLERLVTETLAGELRRE